MKQTIASDAAPKAIGPYSQAIVHAGVAYLSGQIPMDPATGQIPAVVTTAELNESLVSALDYALAANINP